MAICSVTPKLFLSILTVIFWACAAGLLFVGISVYREFSEYAAITEYMYTLLPATVIIAVAIFLFIVGLLGCIGAFKEQKVLLGVYFSVLMVVLVAAAVGGVLGYVYRQKVETGLLKGLDKALVEYGDANNTVWTSEIDYMQSELHCCGVNASSDWIGTPWNLQDHTKFFPASCCMVENCTQTDAATEAYPHGCYTFAKKQLTDHLGLVATVCAAFALVLLVGMICSCILLCRRNAALPYSELPPAGPGHMTV